MKRLIAACVLTAAIATDGVVDASPLSGAWNLPDLSVPYEKHVLSNGLRLIVHEDRKSPVVTVSVWYHVGSKDERPGRTGFAHLFEHLMFNGSEHYDDEFFRPLQAAGATGINGTTSRDRTNYYQTVPSHALDLTLWMESDRMGHLLGAIDQEKLDRQRAVVQNEKRQGESRPYGRVPGTIATQSYPEGHPYSWTTIGSMEDLNAATLGDVHGWFERYYGAANAVLVVSGDVSPADVKRKVEHYFGDIPAGPVIARHQVWVAKMTGEKRATLQDRVPQARLYKVWNIPGVATQDHALLDLAAHVLAGGKSSRLYRHLVHGERIATDVSAGVGPFEIGSQLTLEASVLPGRDLHAVESAMDREVARLLRDGPTVAELDRARTFYYASTVRGLESVGSKASLLAQGELYAGRPDFFHTQYLRWQREATPACIRAAMQRWLSDGVFVLEVRPRPTYEASRTGADRSQLPMLGQAPDLVLPPLQPFVLSNGLEVVLAEQHGAPVVQLSLLIDAGAAADRAAGPGVASMMFSMLDEGTGTRDALQIAERREALSAHISGSSGVDSSSLSLNALKSRLAESLELYADLLLNPTFPEGELERLKQQALAALAQQRSSPDAVVARILPRLVYGEGHPYASVETEETLLSIGRAELQAFYRTWMRPDNARLLVVGDVTLSELRPLLEKYLASWKAPADPLPATGVSAVDRPDRPRVFLLDRPDAQQSVIVAAHVAPRRKDEQYLAMSAVNVVLGGSFTSRVNMNLREDKGWAYGARSSYRAGKGLGLFSMSSSVQTNRTASAMQEMLKEARELTTTRPAGTEEIQAAIDTMVLTLPGRNETLAGVAGSYATLLTYGLEETYWNDYVSHVRSLGPPELEAAARRLIHPDALTWVVAGDLSKVERDVRALSLGEIRVIDADGNAIR